MTTTALATTTAPKPVATAATLYIVEAVLGLVAFVVSLLFIPQAIAAAEAKVRAQTTNLPSSIDVHQLIVASTTTALVIGGIVALAYAVLTILFARKMRAGRNWARIVLLVFVALHVLGLLALLTGASDIVSTVIAAVAAAIGVVAAVLSFRPEASSWFRELKAARTA